MNEKSKIRFGIIGCGNISHIRYLPFISQIEDAQLVAVCDKKEDVAKSASERFEVPSWYVDYRRMLDREALDAVVIATEHPYHAQLSLDCMEAEKHVLIEKPMATSIRDADRLVKKAEETGVIFMPLPFDLYPNFLYVKRVVDEGLIGFPTSVDSMFYHCGPSHASWFYTRFATLGSLADLGVYPLSRLTGLFGPVEKVVGFVNTRIKSRKCANGEVKGEVEDNAVAALHWENGVVGTIRANWCAPMPKEKFLYQTRILGPEGIIYLDTSVAPVVIYLKSGKINNAKQIEFDGFPCYVPQVPRGHDHLDILNYFVKCIREGKKPVSWGPSGEHQKHVIEIILRVYESSDSGKVEHLTTTF